VARARSLSEFQASFPDETSCAAFLFERRLAAGVCLPGLWQRTRGIAEEPGATPTNASAAVVRRRSRLVQ